MIDTQEYGYLGVALAVGWESMGIPIPCETGLSQQRCRRALAWGDGMVAKAPGDRPPDVDQPHLYSWPVVIGLDLNPAHKNKGQNYDEHHTQNACRRRSPSCRIRPCGQCPDKAMKKFPSLLLAMALAVSFSSPLMAKSQSPSMTQSHISKGLQSQKTTPIQRNSKSAAQGNVSDIPMNQPECKKAGGTWSDQTLTCNRKGKL